jgi:hypothetical protein
VYTDMHSCPVFGRLTCVQVWVGVHITEAGASFKGRSDWGCIYILGHRYDVTIKAQLESVPDLHWGRPIEVARFYIKEC